MLSLVIPTYNEKENIRELIPRIAKAVPGAEIIVVDDNSPDGTADTAASLGSEYDVKIIRRPGKLGLSSAVLDGFSRARHSLLGVMDADLSHPPEALPRMLDALGTHDIVIGSRHVEGGGIENWPLTRRIVSRGAKLLSRPVTSVRDPMSGFFLLRSSVLEDTDLNPRGYKILLEILAKGRYGSVQEVPITFRDRQRGKSKMDRKEIASYIRHVVGLYAHRVNR